MGNETGASPRPALRFRFPDGEVDTQLLLGHVTDRVVRVWLRAREPSEVRLRIGDEVRAVGLAAPDPDHDRVAAVELDAGEPRPGTPFTVEGLGAVRHGRFAPSDGQPASFGFMFGSCHQPFATVAPGGILRRQPAGAIYPALRDELVRRDASFLLLLGDQVYSDAVSAISVREVLAADEQLRDEELVETYRHLHRGSFGERGFRALLEAFPAYMTWDDHDIYDGAGSLLEPTAFDDRLRAAATTAYLEHQHLRNPGARPDATPPFDYSFRRGDTAFFVFDLRGCREHREGRIVGETQWRRFEAFLDEAAAAGVTTLFVATSVPVVHASPAFMAALEGIPLGIGRDIRDRWDVPAVRHERARLLDLLFGWQTAGPRRRVAILSGDVHVGAAFTIAPARGSRGRIQQWTSSALSTPVGLEHALANRLVTTFVRLGEPSLHVRRHGLETRNNAGYVEVRPREGGGHEVTFTVLAFDQRRSRLVESITRRAP
jgi:hypothetical protein